jgi:hypothetical protein
MSQPLFSNLLFENSRKPSAQAMAGGECHIDKISDSVLGSILGRLDWKFKSVEVESPGEALSMANASWSQQAMGA